MMPPVLCQICGLRRAKRACPAVRGDICTICCGTEREVTLSCPLECQYLQHAHSHEKTLPVEEKDLSNPGIQVTEEFVVAHEELVLFSVYSLLQAALRTHGAIDTDLLAALESLIQTHRTLESGLVYESYSPNVIAASIQRAFTASLNDYQKLREEREAPALASVRNSPLRNSDVLSTLVFLHRVGQQNQNGRPKGRMFIDLLRHMTPDTPPEERPASLLV